MINELAFKKHIESKTGIKVSILQEHSNSCLYSLSHYIEVDSDDFRFGVKVSDHFSKGIEDLNYPIGNKKEFKSTVLKNALVVFIKNKLYDEPERYWIDFEDKMTNRNLEKWVEYKLEV